MVSRHARCSTTLNGPIGLPKGQPSPSFGDGAAQPTRIPGGAISLPDAGLAQPPATSPDGQLIAFIDHPPRGDELGRGRWSWTVRNEARRSPGLFSISPRGLALVGRCEEVFFQAPSKQGSRGAHHPALPLRTERLLARVPARSYHPGCREDWPRPDREDQIRQGFGSRSPRRAQRNEISAGATFAASDHFHRRPDRLIDETGTAPAPG